MERELWGIRWQYPDGGWHYSFILHPSLEAAEEQIERLKVAAPEHFKPLVGTTVKLAEVPF